MIRNGTMHHSASITDATGWLALGAAAALLVTGATRRSAAGPLLAASSVPLLYRGLAGRWPGPFNAAASDDTRMALGGRRGVNVRESVRIERPVAEVYRYWRRLENLPRVMSHLERVTETSDRHSSWIARGPADLRVEWAAELINEVDDQLLAWRSLPGSDVVTAGSVTFRSIRGGRGTQLNVRLQYGGVPGGKAASYLASLFGAEPSQMIREDLRRFKQLMEAGEVSRVSVGSMARRPRG
jgi:uncharacterized membrane protein